VAGVFDVERKGCVVLQPIAEGVWVHESEFLHSQTTVVQGPNGLLLIDPGITGRDMDDLASDLRGLGAPVVAGFSTHPDWDHVLWHEKFGNAPRYATARCTASMRVLLAPADWKKHLTDWLPPEHLDDIPMELFGLLTALPEGATRLPWDGPTVRIVEHRAHAEGHAALVIEDRGVLVAGDMLSDILVPFLDVEAADPVEDHLAALRLFEDLADGVDVVIPGHGSVGRADEVRARIDLDRAYVRALRDGRDPDDPRIGPSAPLDWLADVHEWQARQLAGKKTQSGATG
jgi:glyoxylase-like metal-dependent hydrolase (beta-lactamase superfamily II)